MAVTREAPAQDLVPAPEPGSRLLRRPAVLVLAILALLLAFGWTFLRDPSISAPTRDPAWYTWRSNLIMHDEPGLIAGPWGPISMFSGGYRVVVPLYGSVLQRVAGIDLYTFSAFMMIGIPILTGLALGAFSYRRHRDPLLFLLVMVATAALFMTTPYVGYLDNITVLYLLSLTLAFYEPGQTSWGARSALFLFGMGAAFTHPTTCYIFGGTLLAVFALHFVTSRFSLSSALRRDGPSLLSVGSGMILGLGSWLAGPWGVKGSLADAALPPPYTMEVFLHRLSGWVGSLQPLITFPLILLAIGWVIYRARKDRRAADTFGTVSGLWLLPLLGVFGFLVGKTYPYYRFMNATAALMPLLGLGLWVAVRWLLSRGGTRMVAVLGVFLLVGAMAFVWVRGRDASQWAKPSNQWIDQPTRTALTAADAVAAREPGRPIVFILNFGDTYQAYGWAKTFTNVSRTGLPGDAVKRSMSYFGSVHDFLANRPTELSDPTYNEMSRDFFTEVQALERTYPQPPVVFLIRQFNGNTENAALLDQEPPPGYLARIGDDIAVVTGRSLATPSQETLDAGRAAEAATAALYSDHPGIFGNLGHTLSVLGALGLLLVVPGLIAARWFELDDVWLKVALVPGISIGLTVIAAIAWVSIRRAPFTTADGWVSLGLATAVAVGLRVGKPRLDRLFAGVSRFFAELFAVFSNRSFSALMGTQFVAQAADGIVQASLAKSIAFGGEKGFDVASAPSARYLLVVVLALYVPYTVVSPFVGAFIDRYDRKLLLIRSNLFRATAVALAALALAAAGDALPDAILILAILVALACTRILLAIKSAGIPAVVRGRDLLQANGLSQAGGAIFQVVGGGVALVGTALAPSWIVALLGAALYLVAAIVARSVERLEYERRTSRFAEEVRRVFRDIATGLHEVFGRPAAALGLAGFQALRMEFFGFVALVFALQARHLLSGSDSDKTVLAIAGACGAIGAAIGMVLAQKLKDRVPPYRLLVSAMAALGVGVILFGGVQTIAGYSAITFVGALGFFLGKISADTIMQQALSDDFRGRGFSLFDIAYNLGWIVPALVLSLVWNDDRVRLILIGSGIAFLLVTAAVYRWARSIKDQLANQDDIADARAATADEGAR
ncbi:MAG TPA: MFS transporter [Actinomycetota bacterium]|nr:MFS transporter [Actinomycetota bacterium]